MEHLFRGTKTFRVLGTKAMSEGKTLGSFAYTKYNHARNMWWGEIWTSNVINKAMNQVQGNSAEAAEITAIINWVADIISRSINNGIDSLNIDEQELLRQISLVSWIGKTPGEDKALSLLDYSYKVGNSQNAGKSFEERIDELFRSLFYGGTNSSYLEGHKFNDNRLDQQVDIRSQIGEETFKGVVELINSNKEIRGRRDGTFDLSGDQFKRLRKKIKDEIFADANLDLNNLFGGKGIEIQYTKRMGEISKIIVAKVRKHQKLDLSVPSTVEIIEGLDSNLERLAQLVRGKTFTVKNYTEDNYSQHGGFELGDAQDARKLSALFAYATGNTTYSDVATFVYATREVNKQGRIDPVLKRYRSWANTIYELLGVGTRADGRLPDYFIGNLYTPGKVGLGHVTVRSVKDYLSGLQSGNQFVYSSGNRIKI